LPFILLDFYFNQNSPDLQDGEKLAINIFLALAKIKIGFG